MDMHIHRGKTTWREMERWQPLGRWCVSRYHPCLTHVILVGCVRSPKSVGDVLNNGGSNLSPLGKT